jgi:hypothetical protein
MTEIALDPKALETARRVIAMDCDSEGCDRRFLDCDLAHCICQRYATNAIRAYLEATGHVPLDVLER